MTRRDLVVASLRHYWRTNVAVALGVGVAVASLAGALVVGASVRTSLRELALSRLGRTDIVVTPTTLFTEQLGERLEPTKAFQAGWRGPVPLLGLEGVVLHERSGARAGSVQVFGVDDRFWHFHEAAGVNGPAGRDAYLSPALARELGAADGDALLLRVQKPSTIPAGLLQGRRDDPGRGIRLTLARVLPRELLGDFSPRPQQGPSRTMFVPLDRLQRDLDLLHRANMLLIGRKPGSNGDAAGLEREIRQQADLADLGVRLRPGPAEQLIIESETGLLNERIEAAASAAAREIGVDPVPVLTYLATAIKANGRETPYSLVTAMPEGRLKPAPTRALVDATRAVVPATRSQGRLKPAPTRGLGDATRAVVDAMRSEGRLKPAPTPSLVGAGFSRPVVAARFSRPVVETGFSRPVVETGFSRSVVAARFSQSDVGAGFSRPIWLTQWTADDLAAKVGDRVTLEYYLWSDAEGLTTSSAEFTIAAVLPMEGLAVDADLTPAYPGMSTSANMTDWDPPFPVDLQKIRDKDEEYWDKYLTAPKAFIRIDDGQALWRSQYGQVSSLRLPAGDMKTTELHAAYRTALSRQLASGAAAEITAVPLREQALAAASGTTDFGEYFTYFSFFLVVSSLLLTLLFFRLGVEQRAREVGLLAAMGYTPRAIRSLLLAEGALLAVAGAIVGVAGALAYSWLIMLALRTWWVDAVGTTDLQMHPSPAALAGGVAAGVLAGLACIAWSLRVLRRSSARQLMSGGWVDADAKPGTGGRRLATIALAAAACAIALVAAGFVEWIPPAAAFFGSGTLLLAAGLCAIAAWLRGTSRYGFIAGGWPIARLGLRNARYRPSRSVLSVALIAAATFLIVAVGAFRRGAEDVGDRRSSSGGYALIAETLAPLMHDPGTRAGREALNLDEAVQTTSIARFRLRPGDDASCLNLYRPQNPRLLGANEAFMRENRFSFAETMSADGAEQDNPWLLLNQRFEDGAVPVIGDATSLAYVFHLSVGDDFVMQGPDGSPLRLRIVASLRDSVLQSELIMADAQFTRLFPRNEGYRVFLVETAPPNAPALSAALESQLQDFGMDVQSTEERLASYHRVENTFLTTFQALGALGLVLGTLGLGTVLLRNVLERRRELALLQATGYRRAHLVQMVLAESAFLLGCGLALGVACAAIAVAPAYVARAQAFPILPTLGLLAAVLAAGLLSTVMATRVVARSPLLEALKNE